jgi:hypothetical protein
VYKPTNPRQSIALSEVQGATTEMPAVFSVPKTATPPIEKGKDHGFIEDRRETLQDEDVKIVFCNK